MVTCELATDRLAPLTRRQLVWLLFVRVLVTALFLGGTLIYQMRGGVPQGSTAHTYLYLLFAASFAQSLLSALLLFKVRLCRVFLHLQFSWDLLFCTALIYLTGGLDSLFSFLFILVILGASVYLPRRDLYVVASAAAILYGSLLDLQYYGYLPQLRGLTFSTSHEGGEFFFAVFVNVLAFFLAAFFSGILVERLRRSQRDLERREVDYEELETLNKAILANTPSGLMIVNEQGRIRSFNAAASRISGFSLTEVYNRPVKELFPDIPILRGEDFMLVSRGEGAFVDPKGEQHILGYATSLLDGPDGKTIGLLVTFQDLTHLKSMEDELKRADRLAAVGRLASGMAHEIRNPLASISGSVQLLMENPSMNDDDRRLMRIVVREAERLSLLLSDFLVFARPAKPRKESVNVPALLDDLIEMASCDPRFARVRIFRDYPTACLMSADPQQLHQALWNLAINGAEAMVEGGTLHIGIHPERNEIYVEDSGPGIPDEIRRQIFDPFFTTKERGTGLGLATVHTILEAHGGSLDVRAVEPHGTRFTLTLP
ncbi:MAG: ATP-binding protein [Desulfuromonadales bacterium]|nr:ATP-binding protein [Desulfuromonadales bacterium]MDW7756827.1 ATP-binding protein [Desulfuromonadales bacterium]